MKNDLTSDLSQKPIIVFFTHGVSLETWEQQGLFSREVRFYQELTKKTGEIWFFTYGKNDKRFQERVGDRIRIFPKQSPLPAILYGFFLPFIYRNQIRAARMIRIHQMAGAIPALISHIFLHKPLLVRCGYQWSRFLQKQHAGMMKKSLVYFIEFLSYRFAKRIIVSTEADRQYVSTRYRIAQEKIHVISNYVDTEQFTPLHRQKNKQSICFVGRLEPQKNLLPLVEAAVDTGAHLIFYGEGSQKDELAQKAKTLGVDLSLRGHLPNEHLSEALNACELFVLPSLYEGNPKVLLEAMSCGLPVIGTRVEGIDSIIDHEIDGILCETDSPSIKNALVQLLNNPEKQQSLGKAAREKIQRTASLSQAIQKESDILTDLSL